MRMNLEKIISNGWIQFTMGWILILSIVVDDFLIKTHHGLLFIASYHIIASLPNVLQGLERINRWKK